MAKLSKSEWVDVRDLWEADPKLSFGTLATEYGVSKQVICARSKKENWTRRGNLAVINREAIRRADALTDFVKTDEKVDDNEKTDETFSLKREIGTEAAIDRRSDILVKHRRQIVELDSMQNEAKVLFDGALKTKEKNDFWMAKIAIDCVKDHVFAVSKKQMMERKCWGMDTLDLSPHDLESFTDKELDEFGLSGKIPQRFRKIFRGYRDD